MDWSNVFQSIWDLAENLIKAIGSVWSWLTTPIKIDIPFLIDIPLIGGWFNMTLDYSPIGLLGVGVLVLIGLWVVKHIIPLG